MATFVIPNTGKKYLLQFKLGLGGADLSGAKLHLCTDATTFDANPRDQTLAHFVEQTFAGYAAIVVGPWTAVLYDGTNHWYYSLSKVCVFTSTDAINSFNVAGWYLTDAGGTNLIAFAQYFPLDSVIPPLGSLAVQLQMDELSQYSN